MNTLYLFLNLGSVCVPFLFSFHPKLKFYRHWKALAISIPITMSVFIPWDVLFTNYGFWGFNDTYFLGSKVFGLPIEEWLFFICIPYACVFMHYSITILSPNLKLKVFHTKIITKLLLLLFAILSITYIERWYTFVNFGYAFILLFIASRVNIRLLQHYFITFLFILIPFFIVNGILTGSFIENEVVWYNNTENLGIRLFTIPIEDTVYAFTLILTNLLLVEYFERKSSKKEY